MRSVRLQRNAWGGNMWDEQPLGQQTSDAFIRKHLNDAAATNNLHNCSHCLNHSDHQQASLDISLSGFHQPMIVIVMTSWWIYWPGSVALSIWATVGWLNIICYIFDWEPLIWSLYNQLWFITRHLKIKLRSGTSSNIYWMNQIVKLRVRVRVRVKVKSQKSKLDPEVGVVIGWPTTTTHHQATFFELKTSN